MKGNFESLTALAQRIEAVEAAKEDYLASTKTMTMTDDDTLAVKTNGHDTPFGVAPIAHAQIAARLEIPKGYYDRMVAIPGLRAHTVNAWLGSQDEKRMVRTLDGRVRAYLSDSFRPYDHANVLQGLMPVLAQFEGLQVKACSLTEARMYIQFLFPSLVTEIKPGVRVGAGLTITNSEVGWGAVDARSFLLNYVCSNGMVAESILRKYHVGRQINDSDVDMGVFRSDTVEADINAFKLKLRDIVGAALSEARFADKVAKMTGAIRDEIRDPIATVEKVTKRLQFNATEAVAMMNNLVKGGDSTRWGLSNAITALVHTTENIDRQYEIEKAGWDVIELTPSQWSVLN